MNIISNEIEKEDVKLILSDYFEELPVYKLLNKSEHKDLPIDIKVNSIPFFLEDSTIDQYPCFVLHYSDWDDYGSKTSMSLLYRENAGVQPNSIGKLKILRKEVTETWNTLSPKFYYLNAEYCSLGQESLYYLRLKRQFPQGYQNILLALRDVALFPRISEEFEAHPDFRSSLI